MKRSVIFAASLIAGISAIAHAETKEEKAIDYRQGVMTAIGWNFGPIGAMVKGEQPFDKNVVARNAEFIAVLSKMAPDGFIPGSDKGQTKAKPEAFTDVKFKGGMEKFQTEAAKLAEVAKTGNMDQIKPQFGEVAKTCKACHDNFRQK